MRIDECCVIALEDTGEPTFGNESRRSSLAVERSRLAAQQWTSHNIALTEQISTLLRAVSNAGFDLVFEQHGGLGLTR